MERHPGSGAGSEPTAEQGSWFVRGSAAGGIDPDVRDETAAPRTREADDGAVRKDSSAAVPDGQAVEGANLTESGPEDAGGIKHATDSGGPVGKNTASADKSASAEQSGPARGTHTSLPAVPPALPRRYATRPRVANIGPTERGTDPLGPPISGTRKAEPAGPQAEQESGGPLGSPPSADDRSLPSAGEPVAVERDVKDPRSPEVMDALGRPGRRADPFNALDIREWFRDARASRPGAETAPSDGAYPIDPAERSVPHPPPRRRSPRAAVARGVGEILVTVGLVILLFCVYQLFYTNIESNRAQAKIKNSLEQSWKPPAQAPDAKPARESFSGLSSGDAFAIIHIPRLGRDWEKPILEGVGLDELARGVGHYPDSAMPGKIGNFAVAGHRATHGEPFRNLNKLRQGDIVIVETEKNWYRYVIDSNQIVDPTDVEVVLPVPNQPGVKPTERLITLTTCNPRWASTERLIYWGHLDTVMSKAAGTPADLRA